MENKGFLVCFVLNIVLAITDLVLSGFVPRELETNILTQWTGSLLPVWLVNIALFCFLWWWYHKSGENPTQRFYVINTLVLFAFVRLRAISNTIEWLNNPELMVLTAKTITTSARMGTQKMLFNLILSPLILPVISFLLWKLDHYVYRRDVIE